MANFLDPRLADRFWSKVQPASALAREGVRRFNMSKTHCPKGHPYSEANTRRVGNRRLCIECGRASSREYQRRKAAALRAV